ncbi:MAG: DVUA0089 family protein [Acidobacteriaceae bacterium]|nr:DVUA0089 family protein [Acidobacteriaceae bacterium]
MASRKSTFALPMLLLGITFAPLVKANSFSFIGTFQQDDNVQLFGFTVAAPSAVTVETWSYGGGVDALGQTIPRGGFAPVLSLFSSSGTLIDFTVAGSCPPGNLDVVTGLCGDASLTGTLGSGSYLLAVTEYFNIPNGLNLADGFLESGAGNFTGPLLCGVQGGFLDVACNQRNGNFELDIVGASTASAVPEPASVLLFAFALMGFAATVFTKSARETPHA